ncbi:alpha/beta fold hydrolase [Paenibacillus tundrae]|uniref:Pimeloyl-ACP methyl ester carboxylesterase n=1 Tax=Paenibacillus tundrae TaxID=528187 RepID=A0ABT9WEC9_9BACL|nr:alpha/beta hydrolase [Paenibacillus tundrae]MDQ0171611.1 pimeloyl-ACP methyl ester carboxylesterase [Paenibacillus tundrae]
MKKWRKRLRITAIAGLALILVLLGSGVVYQQVETRKDLNNFTPPGKLYKVHGENMHLYTGGQGDVTVVMASGWGTANPYVDYYPLYEQLSPYTKFAVYDRFGYGYSEVTDKKRDVDSIAEELHELLTTSGQQPPYILVGHSLGSLETLRYAQKYPNEVKGIMMIDGGSPEYYAKDEDNLADVIGGFMNQFRIQTGLFRLSLQSEPVLEATRANRNNLKFVPDELKQVDTTALLLNYGNANTVDELREMNANATVVMNHTKPLSVPLTILTADYLGSSEAIWDQTQTEFTSWSTQPKHVTVKDSEHYVHQYHPEQVADEILELAAK